MRLKMIRKLSDLQPWVADSGEGRWTVQTAMDFDVPAQVITSFTFCSFSVTSGKFVRHEIYWQPCVTSLAVTK